MSSHDGVIRRLPEILRRRGYTPDGILLFGSASRGEQLPTSDVDVLVYDESKSDITYLRFFEDGIEIECAVTSSAVIYENVLQHHDMYWLRKVGSGRLITEAPVEVSFQHRVMSHVYRQGPHTVSDAQKLLMATMAEQLLEKSAWAIAQGESDQARILTTLAYEHLSSAVYDLLGVWERKQTRFLTTLQHESPGAYEAISHYFGTDSQPEEKAIALRKALAKVRRNPHAEVIADLPAIAREFVTDYDGILLFGSASRGEQCADSDVDVLVYQEGTNEWFRSSTFRNGVRLQLDVVSTSVVYREIFQNKNWMFLYKVATGRFPFPVSEKLRMHKATIDWLYDQGPIRSSRTEYSALKYDLDALQREIQGNDVSPDVVEVLKVKFYEKLEEEYRLRRRKWETKRTYFLNEVAKADPEKLREIETHLLNRINV